MGETPEIWKAVAMADHFEKIQKLPEPIPGCPNFRRVPGYKVYLCGQPTTEGFEKCLEKVCGSIYPKDGKIIWFNLRQEPVVYVNGQPLCARPSNKIGEYAELGNVTRDKLKEDEAEFVRVCEGKMKDNANKLKYVDVNKKENEVEVKSIVTLHDVIEGLKEKFPGLVHMRIPMCNSASPLEQDFDTLCDTLVGTSINTPIILNDQVHRSKCVSKVFFVNFAYLGRSVPCHHRQCGRLHVQGVPAQRFLRGPGGDCARHEPHPAQDGQVQDGPQQGRPLQGRV